MKIILGSSSAGRKLIMNELAQKFIFDFEVMSPDINEKAIRSDSPSDLVMAIANAKADVLVSKIKEPAILICSDQVVLYGGKIREKPVDEMEAREFLQSYKTVHPETLGAVVIVNTKTGKRASGLQKSKVYFKPLPKKIIDEHIETGMSLRGAGGFVINDPILKDYIDHIEGGFDSASGLSKELVKRLIVEVGGSLSLKSLK
ncbi:MAG: Maf family protein [Candidatus Paceibacterota bacterium]|jgi:septum formation protein